MVPLPWYALPQYAPIGIISVTTETLYERLQESAKDLRVQALEDELGLGIPKFKIFFLPNISESQVGSTYTLDSGPVFQQTVDFLTNGRIGWLTFGLGTGFISFTKNYFNGNYPGVDLMGFTIEGLDLSINSYHASWHPEGGEGGGFFWDCSITFVIRGRFPLRRKEPPPPEGPSPPLDGSTVVAKVR